jgi:para-nitrobenzyl esterase
MGRLGLGAAGIDAHGRNAVYYYRFAHSPPFPAGTVYDGWGASHYSELWYTFDHLGQEPWAWSAADRKLADEMSSYWVNLRARETRTVPACPNGPFTPADGRTLILDAPISAGPVPELKSLQVFDAVYSQVRGAAFGDPPQN